MVMTVSLVFLAARQDGQVTPEDFHVLSFDSSVLFYKATSFIITTDHLRGISPLYQP
jgi:hypothetical protein